jgi:hypothetical protein
MDQASISWKLTHFITDAAITLTRLRFEPGAIKYFDLAAAITNQTRSLQ